MGDTVYQRSDQAMTSDLGTDLVLVSGATGKAYRFNQTARSVFLRLPATAQELTDEVLSQFDVARDEASTDVDSILQEMIEAGFVEATN